MTILVYFNVSETSRRLQLSREVSESARQITERITQEVKQNGILVEPNLNPTFSSEWNFLWNYGGDGNKILVIGDDKNAPKKIFYYGTASGPSCPVDAKHCGLYLWENGKTPYNLVDSFRADDDKKRVTIQDLKFYVTGGDNSANKVTLKMTLALIPQAWVSANLVNSTKLEIQTTFSERPYKID